MSPQFLERFSPKPTQAEFYVGDDDIKIVHPELVTLSQIEAALRQKKVAEKVLRGTAELIFALLDGMRQEYEQYQAKGMKVKPAPFRLDFYFDKDDEEQVLHFDSRKKIVILPFRTVLFAVQNRAYLNQNNPESIQDQINNYRLWGGEEANHSIFRQFKRKYPNAVKAEHGSDAYLAQEHEFRGIQANIRQAKREQMPQSKIDELEELLKTARQYRFKQRVKKRAERKSK